MLSVIPANRHWGITSLDIIYLTHEKPNTISVADIREQINHDIEIKPYSSKYKVYIVDEAEKNESAGTECAVEDYRGAAGLCGDPASDHECGCIFANDPFRCVMLDIKPVSDEKPGISDEETSGTGLQSGGMCAFARGNVGRAVALASSEQFNELKDVTVSGWQTG